MQIIDLFSGIGGFSLAGRWAGWETVCFCEIDPFCQRVLKHHFPGVPIFDNVKNLTINEIEKTKWDRSKPTIITGGFPCQPFSAAGKRKGTEDERYLWPSMLRIIREVAPDWVVGENVRGLVNWSDGLVFEQVCADLEALSYEVWPFILPAAGVNAPHRRDRVWFVAHAKNVRDRRERGTMARTQKEAERKNDGCKFDRNGKDGLTPDTEKTECQQSGDTRSGRKGFADVHNGGYAPDTGLLGQAKHEKQATGFEQCGEGTIADTDSNGHELRGLGKSGQAEGESISQQEQRQRVWANDRGVGEQGAIADTYEKRLQGQATNGNMGWEQRPCISSKQMGINWQNFPTVSPFYERDDGVSKKLLIFVVKELYYEISKTSKENRIENLSEVWERISPPEVWEKVRGLYSLESKEVLFQTMQLYQAGYIQQGSISPFGDKVSEPLLRKLRKYGEFRRTPQGQELEKQRSEKFGDALSYLPHEIPLAARAFENSIAAFERWHRNESIKALGNSIVPEVAYQIFKSINEFKPI